jgi:type I restriction enzyme R subunit
MRRALSNLNSDLVKQHPHYVARVTADEGSIGKGFLSEFQDLDSIVPVVLTTSQLLTTGVNAPMVKNIALARVVGSMSEFKQIIGRGTRVRSDYGKFMFTILDYTGAASQHFADPEFDGDPELISEETIDDHGEVLETKNIHESALDAGDDEAVSSDGGPAEILGDDELAEPRKFYVDGGEISIAHEVVSELDAHGKKLRVIQYRDYTAEQVRKLFGSANDLQEQWKTVDQRAAAIEELESRGIDFDELAHQVKQPSADPLDLLCHIAFSAPLRTRRERAERILKDRVDYFDKYGDEARAVLEALLEKYAEHGLAQFKMPDVLKLPPISDFGSMTEIINMFGGATNLKDAVAELQSELYAVA